MSVPFHTGWPSHAAQRERLGELIDEALDAGVLVNGPLVERFERAIEEYTGARHAVAVASGSDALIVALEACGVGPGDEVIVPVYTFFASASSVVHAGARPVFADIDPDSYAITPATIEERITPRTRAIVPVHLFTQMADMAAIGELAERHGLTVVEDSAEAIGMSLDGRHAGRFGRAGVLSFFPTKTLGALGDAGMLLTEDDDVAASARQLRNHGQAPGEPPYTWHRLGINSRMDDVQAAVLLTRLEALDAAIERRAELAAAYDARLGRLPGVTVPRLPDGGRRRCVYYVYLIEAEDRDGLAEHLAGSGIETETYYPRPLHLQPCFAGHGHGEGDYPVAEAASRRALALPFHADLTGAELDEVCSAVEGFYAERERGGAVRAVAGGAS